MLDISSTIFLMYLLLKQSLFFISPHAIQKPLNNFIGMRWWLMSSMFSFKMTPGTWFHHNKIMFIGNEWVFRVKRWTNESIECFRTCLIVKGFHQQEGVNYIYTFSLVVKPNIVCLIISNQWQLHQLDIHNAFF
jgi:hypothetical protein